jgi:glycosyl hydrolase family 4
MADARGVRPGRYGELPAACTALNQIQIAVQRLTVQAAMTGNRGLVHVAVALDPLTSAMQTLPEIREMADRMLAAEAEWLPQFAGTGQSPPGGRGCGVSGVRSSPHRAPAAVRMPRQERAVPDAPRTGRHTSRWSPRR